MKVKRIIKKTVGALLAVMLLAGTVPTFYAAENSASEKITIADNAQISEFRLAYVGDTYVFTDGNNIYMQTGADTSTRKTLAAMSNSGNLMTDGNSVIFTVGCENATYSYGKSDVYFLNSGTLECTKLFTSNDSLKFLTSYNDCIYYTDDGSLCKYDLSSQENSKISTGESVGSGKAFAGKIYLQTEDSDILEYNLTSGSCKKVLSDCNIIADYRNSQADKICFSASDGENDWYIHMIDKDGSLTTSAAISAKYTLMQGLISSDGKYAYMMSNMSYNNDIDLYKVELSTGKVADVIENGAKFKGKGAAMTYDPENRDVIYFSPGEYTISALNGDKIEEYSIGCKCDTIQSWVRDGYVINGRFEWGKISGVGDEPQTTTAPTGNVDYTIYDPADFLGMSFNEIKDIFGDDYKKIGETATTIFINYPDTGNPIVFGVETISEIVEHVYINQNGISIPLFDDITSTSTLSDMDNSSTKYAYTKTVTDTNQSITYKLDNGITIVFEWASNDFNNEAADTITLTGRKTATAEVNTTTESTTAAKNSASQGAAEITSDTATSATSATSSPDTATVDSSNGGAVQTGVASIVIVLCALAAAGSGAFLVWYKRFKIGK